MTHGGAQRRGQYLYPLVFITSLSLVALSSIALATLGRGHVTDTAIAVAVGDDQAVVTQFVASNLSGADLDPGAVTTARHDAIASALRSLVQRQGYRDVTLLTRDGAVLAGASADGSVPALVPEWTSAVTSGHVQASLTDAGSGGPGGTSGPSASNLVEAIPVVEGGEVRLVFLVRRDGGPILAGANDALRDLAIVMLTAGVVLAVLLHQIFRAANHRLSRQDAALVESRRRDPLTGLLNHGAAVSALTDLVEQSRSDSSSLGVALLDIDNFRLLNDVHGSTAGDQALLAVAAAFRPDDEAWTVLARFGPDEFLAIAPASVARALPAATQRVRDRLEATHLTLPGTERLPITVSVGIAYLPFHADNVIELISAATTALADAKSSGGNEIAIADAWTDEPRAPHTMFDALQSLVIAIDRKDRYTKLHSEDVAAYALFLAESLGLPDEMMASLRVAALLHDVGKIGVPDDILRKPGLLTPHEFEIVKQHVALGDVIVRGVPDVEHVRAGVRYHHERWDGNGYMVGLAGENIPLIARILAVGDAFSAMTTTRPYRKAMSVDDALAELRAVAGTQLDATLVETFVTGMELDPKAPMPGANRNRGRLWTPGSRAA